VDPNCVIYRDIQPITVCSPQLPHPPADFHGMHYHSTPPPEGPPPKKERRFSLWWGISGGTILSAVGFVALALFEQYNDGLTELRNDLKHFHMTCGDLVKKDSMQNFRHHLWATIKELQTATQVAKEREGRIVQLEKELKNDHEDRKELNHEVLRLRERLASVEGQQAALHPLAAAHDK
jgi:cell division protein FtsB